LRGIVENGQILLDRPARRFRRKPFVALNSLLPVGIGLDQTGIYGEAFPTHQSLLDAAAQDVLEHAPKEIAFSEAPVPVL
jgi:hypothetical protein